MILYNKKIIQLGENSIMDFIEQIKQLSKRISTLKNSVVTEEATKTSFIMPFFQILGYDVFNPTEFFPEYVADVGIKKGEKVDYAIIIDGKPCIFVEYLDILPQLQLNLEYLQMALFIDSIQILKKIISWI